MAREKMFRPLILDSSVMMSSVMPSREVLVLLHAAQVLEEQHGDRSLSRPVGTSGFSGRLPAGVGVAPKPD